MRQQPDKRYAPMLADFELAKRWLMILIAALDELRVRSKMDCCALLPATLSLICVPRRHRKCWHVGQTSAWECWLLCHRHHLNLRDHPQAIMHCIRKKERTAWHSSALHNLSSIPKARCCQLWRLLEQAHEYCKAQREQKLA